MANTDVFLDWAKSLPVTQTDRPARTYTVNGAPAPLDANGSPIGNTDDDFGYAGWTPPTGSQSVLGSMASGGADRDSQVRNLYASIGRTGANAPTQDEINYWANQGGDIRNSFLTAAAGYANDPKYAQNAQLAQQQLQASPTPQTGTNLFNFGAGAGGIPNYAQIAQQQYQLNQQNARQQMLMNNPNQYGPGGSQVRTQNPDGTWSLTTTLSPDLQKNYDAQNALNSNVLQRANTLATGPQLSYAGAPQAPTYDTSKAPALSQFDTSGVSALPDADAANLAKMRDSVYQQQTQYLDPQFQQAQSDLESKLANQGIMPGSEAYNREMNNFALTKQKAYGDARNSAIQAGGQEQSRLFGLGLQKNQAGQQNALNQFNTGLQSHVAGMNDALAGFNTGLQSRQQGVSEANTLHNSPFNDLASLRSGSQISLPTFAGSVGTSIPGVDLLNAANMGFNANLGLSNADAARSAGTTNGLFGLGAAAIQGGALNGAGSYLNNLFGQGNTATGYTGWLNSNSGLDLSPSDLGSVL